MTHTTLERFVPTSLCLSVLLGAAHAQGSVWVVDDQAGPGVDFGDIFLAVSAAADGDLLVVREGHYAQFEVTNKALTIVGFDGAKVLSSVQAASTPIRVTGLSAERSVVIRNLVVDSPNLISELPAVAVSGCAGSVLFEDCELRTPRGIGASVSSSSSVTFARCSILGQSEPITPFPVGTITWEARPGLLTVDSDVYLFDCDVSGSYGRDAQNVFFLQYAPGNGGTAVRQVGGSLLASGSVLSGGAGGHDALATVCFPAGNGGVGLQLEQGAAAPVARLLATNVTGGSGGQSDCIDPDGVAGTDTVVTVGSIEPLGDSSRSFRWDSPAESGQTFEARYAGAPGDFVWLLLGFGLGPDDYLEGFASALLIQPSFLVVALGSTPPSGELVQTYTALDLGLLSKLSLVGQGAFLDTSLGFWVSGPSALEIVSAGSL